MDGPFEHIDPQVVFVIVALVIGALQALWEKRKRSRAARELDREAGPAADRKQGDKGPAKGGTFRELYEEYRRQVTAGQATPSGPPKTLTPPPQPTPKPAQPPPLPTAKPVRAKPVDAAPERWAKEAPAPWQPPKIRRAQEQLSPQELAALARLQQRSRRHPEPHPPAAAARRLLASSTAVRDAIIVRELLGPPKGLGPLA